MLAFEGSPKRKLAPELDAAKVEEHDKLLNDAKQSPIVSEKYRTYKSTLITALDDGVITSDEGAILATLRETLGISDAQHASLLAELRDNIK